MPARERQYLVQEQDDGTIATVGARSHVGAIRRYLFKHPRTPEGTELRVKEREVDEPWVTYRVSR